MVLNDAYSAAADMLPVMADISLLRRMALFEATLAQAEAEAGVIPEEAAAIITEVAGALQIDAPAMAKDAILGGTVAIPLVKSLTAAVRARNPAAAAFVHFGATSQDAIDSALVLQLGDALVLLDRDLTRVAAAAAALARRHRDDPMLGRTVLQPATPITFGLKAAQWLTAAREARSRLRRIAGEALVLQFGGAAGTLGSLGDKGARTAEILFARLAALNAYPPARSVAAAGTPLPWHTRRGALMSLAGEIAIVTGVAGKIARDLSSMMQFEVAEAFEPADAGRGASSAMPHKRNPVRCMLTVSAALRTPGLVSTLLTGMVQEHERALGGWQAEWGALPELVKLCSGALSNMAETLEGLQVDVARMRQNFDALHGLPMTEMLALALAQGLGRSEAFALVETAAREVGATGRSLAEVVKANPEATRHVPADRIDFILDPLNNLGATQAFIESALTGWDAARN
ncbi:MAG: 3-carboxy-cis,cis-muconate cycloisomerase [Hyphomicrobiales bacterium]|nr:3-carboxy-cis,cis-muconate cycloisomerase [Hyphomicrobiales bacterium]